jgi:DNA uptake protein ComE-like DNA-binding protein
VVRSVMPTPAERKALLFFSTVLVLGASTRAYQTLHSRSASDSKARSALERQIAAADSARKAGLRKPKREKKQKTPPKPLGPVDLDVATEKEIESLRYVGPALAKRIVADRDSFGPFGSMDGLTRVKGVGSSMVAKLDSSVTFSLVPRPTNTVISRPSELPKARRKPHRRDMRP